MSHRSTQRCTKRLRKNKQENLLKYSFFEQMYTIGLVLSFSKNIFMEIQNQISEYGRMSYILRFYKTSINFCLWNNMI